MTIRNSADFTRVTLLVASAFFLGACVTSGTDALLLPSTDTSQGGGSKTGQFPNINDVPRGATAQLTEEEKARVKSELKASTASTRRQAAANNNGAYRRDVAALGAAAQQARQRSPEATATSGQGVDAFREEVAGHVARRQAEIKAAGAVEEASD